MKKLLVLFAGTVLAGSAFAACCDNKDSDDSGFKVKLTGSADFEVGMRSQKNVPADSTLTKTSKNVGVNSSVAANLSLENSTDCFKYGGVIALGTTTQRASSAKKNGSYVFLEGEYGRVELGSNADAAYAMALSAYDIARATGDNWTGYAHLRDNNEYIGSALGYVQSFSSSLKDGKGVLNERARKVTYYSPKFNGFQAGVSYVHDSGNKGSGRGEVADIVAASANQEAFSLAMYNNDFVHMKHLVSGGFSYETNLSDGLDLAVSLTGEYGQNNAFTPGNTSVKARDLKTVSLGAKLNYGSYGFAASYTHFGNSMSLKALNADATSTGLVNLANVGIEKPKWHQITAGVSYVNGPYGASLTFLNVEKLKSKQNSLTLGFDYKMAEGFVPYLEATFFKQKNYAVDIDTDTLATKTHKGAVVLVGTKLSF